MLVVQNLNDKNYCRICIHAQYIIWSMYVQHIAKSTYGLLGRYSVSDLVHYTYITGYLKLPF